MPAKSTETDTRRLGAALRNAFTTTTLVQLHEDAIDQLDIVAHREPWGHLVDALFQAAYPRDTDRLEPDVALVDQLRIRAVNAEHERDEARADLERLETRFDRYCDRLARQRDDARAAGLSLRSHVAELRTHLRKSLNAITLHQHVREKLMADRDRYRRNFSATLLQLDHLAAVVSHLLAAMDEDGIQDVTDLHAKVREVLKSDCDEYMRMALTQEANRYLEENQPSSTAAGLGSSRRAQETAEPENGSLSEIAKCFDSLQQSMCGMSLTHELHGRIWDLSCAIEKAMVAHNA